MVQRTLTQDLMGALGQTEGLIIENRRVIEHARRNKVLLQLLRRLDIEGSLRQRQETAYKKINRALLEIAEKIPHLNYAAIKFFKPVDYVPSDIDLLVTREHQQELLNILRDTGYKQSVKEANCLSFSGKTLVDVYVNPDFANIPYIDGEKLLGFAQPTSVNGVKVKRLRPEAEAVLALSHALFKEQILTLNDYYTAKPYLNNEAVMIAEKLGVRNVLPYSISLFDGIEQGTIESPVKIPISYAAQLVSRKIVGDSLSRRFLPHSFLKLFDPRILTLIKSRLSRQTY